MTVIRIELFERPTADGAWSGDSGYVAVATFQGEIASMGGAGEGGSKRSAAQDAVNALFKRADERERAEHQPLVIPNGTLLCNFDENAPAPHPADQWREADLLPGTPRYVEEGAGRITGTVAIVQALESAMRKAPTPHFRLEYTDSRDARTEREIIPCGLDERRGSLGFRQGGQMLVAIDVEKDEPRHFLVSRIDAITELPA